MAHPVTDGYLAEALIQDRIRQAPARRPTRRRRRPARFEVTLGSFRLTLTKEVRGAASTV